MWQILGIEPTDDIKAIKKAYARLAKQYNPEEHPEEFQRIHTAYRQACAYASSAHHNSDDKDAAVIADASESQSEQCEMEYDFQRIHEDSPVFTENIDHDELITLVIKQIRDIVNNEQTRNSPDKWKSIVKSEAFEALIMDLEFRKRAGDILFGILFHHDTAVIISDGFGYGSKAVDVNYHPVLESRVEISERLLHYKPQKESFTSYYESRRLTKWLLISTSVLLCILAVFLAVMIYYSK